MARLSLIAILAAALLMPAAADARGEAAHHAHGNPARLATAVAKRYWNATPCSGQITVLADMPLPAGLEPSTDAWVTFDSSLGANDLQAPTATYTGCTIGLAHWQWPTTRSMQSDWNMFCLTVIHEMGHLLGHPHSLIPGSVMAPVFINEANVPQICRATRPPGEAVASRSRHR